jgi:MFS family permease
MADKIGPKPLIMAGLSLLAVSLFLQAQIDVNSGYGTLLPAFIVLGIGIALTMSPMSTAAMNAVDVSKAGVASGVLSMGRMVGGSLGIAVTGALFQGSFSSRVDELTGGATKATTDKMFEAVSLGRRHDADEGRRPRAQACRGTSPRGRSRAARRGVAG